MRTTRLIPLIIVPLLLSCAAAKPDVPLTEVPAGPLVRALDERRQSLQSLKAVAAVQITRRGRKRSFDSVGILLKGSDRFKIEAYGPLGQPIAGIMGRGSEIALQLPLESGYHPAKGGLDKVLGTDIEPAELTALLSGNMPALPPGVDMRAACGSGACVLELRQDALVRRLEAAVSPAGTDPRPLSSELKRGQILVYRATFEWADSRSAVPRKVVIENPDRKANLTVEYEEVDVNAPVGDGEFGIPAEGGRSGE